MFKDASRREIVILLCGFEEKTVKTKVGIAMIKE